MRMCRQLCAPPERPGAVDADILTALLPSRTHGFALRTATVVAARLCSGDVHAGRLQEHDRRQGQAGSKADRRARSAHCHRARRAQRAQRDADPLTTRSAKLTAAQQVARAGDRRRRPPLHEARRDRASARRARRSHQGARGDRQAHPGAEGRRARPSRRRRRRSARTASCRSIAKQCSICRRRRCRRRPRSTR